MTDWRRRAKSLEEDLRELAAAVSHDLRAPVRALDGFSRAVAEDAAGDAEERQRHLQFIRDSSRRLSQQIEGLVGLCRLSVVELQIETVDLTALAREILSDLAASQPERTVTVEIAEGLSTTGDPELLRVLYQSLLDNAWKFTANEHEARIRVGSRPREGEGAGQGGAGQDDVRPVFFVADSGVGFSLTNADRLFLPFSRLHPAALYPGLGLGLARARRVIARHGGTLWAESAPATGATFCFVLGDPDLE